MEHPCHRCNELVEDGTPFCPKCGAPQIRVASAENALITPPLEPGTPDEIQPPARPIEFPTAEERGVRWSQALPGAAIAGFLVALSLLLPIARVVLWMLLGGAVAALLYARRRPNVVLTPGAGARIGAISGIFAFVFFAAVAALALVGSGGEQLRAMMQQAVAQAIAANADPKAREVLERFNNPQGIAMMIAVGMALSFVFSVLLATLGGAIGASLFGGRRKPGPPQV